MSTSSIVLVMVVTAVVILAIGFLGYLCYLQIGKWQEHRQMRQAQKDIQKELNNAYNAMLNEAWRCSNQNNRWW